MNTRKVYLVLMKKQNDHIYTSGTIKVKVLLFSFFSDHKRPKKGRYDPPTDPLDKPFFTKNDF